MGSPIKIYDYSGYGLINFYDNTEIREALREYCFNRLLKLEGNERHYNIDGATSEVMALDVAAGVAETSKE